MGDSENDFDGFDDETEEKLFYNQLDQEVGASQRTKAQSESEIEIETDPSEVTGTILGCGDYETKLLRDPLGLIGRTIHDLKDYFSNKTPKLENTVLHIAAWYGNDDVVDLVAKDAPNLLFSFNKNGDTPLHVAARAGNIPSVKKLLATYASFQRREIAEEWIKYKKQSLSLVQDYDERTNMGDLLELVKKENVVEGNTMLHEAMLVSGKKKGMNIGANFFQAFEPYETKDWELGESLSESCLDIANHAKKSALYLAVEAGDQKAVELILDKCPQNASPRGSLSPLLAAIMKRDEGMLKMILNKKPNWIHLMDKHGRLPLHYAASTGYLEGVLELLGKCWRCSNRKDKNGYFPLHLASHGGHVGVVKVLLTYCPNPAELLDSYERNILHIAAKSGKHEVVRYIPATDEHHYYEMMINQRDSRGDTPLHLATRYCHPQTVHCLTWDPRVDLGAINQNKETALDVANALNQPDVENASMRQQLVWIALKSAGVPSSSRVRALLVESKPSYLKPDEESHETKLSNDKEGNNNNERVETLSVVLTLIITASVAACLAVPGETDDKGRARNLNHVMFQIFIICITISLFSSICAIIILFWARLGMNQLVTYSLKIVMPLQGLALISLSLAFMAGIYTVINKLSWLATLFLVMAGIFVVIEISLYILLFLPSSSTNKLLRYMSYYPFLFLASLAESNQGTTSTSFQLLGFEVRAFKK